MKFSCHYSLGCLFLLLLSAFGPNAFSGVDARVVPVNQPLRDWRLEEFRQEQEMKWNDKLVPNSKRSDFSHRSVYLGGGAFGRVSLVKHIASKKFFAMKEQSLSEFSLVEALTMRAVKNPHMVQIHSFFWDAQQANMYIVEEYCAGGDFFAFISNVGLLNEEEVRFYAAQLVIALGRLHKIGVTHRDIHMGNIMLGDDGYLKLGDFGVVALMGDRRLGTKEATPADNWNFEEGKWNDWRMAGKWLFGGMIGRNNNNISPAFRSFLNDLNAGRGLHNLGSHQFFKKYTKADWIAIEKKTKIAPFVLEYTPQGMFYKATGLYDRQGSVFRPKVNYNVNAF